MNYYRKPNKDNFEDDIKYLNNKIDIIYTSIGNIIEERNDLLQLFNSRINDNIPDENIFNDDIKIDSDGRFKLIFTCKSEPSDIYEYVFHIFIKLDFNNINLKFIINNTIQIQILGQSRRLVGPRPILALPIYHSFVPGLTVACSEG